MAGVNLFVAGWNLGPTDDATALDALDTVAASYPLDPETRQVHRVGAALVASISHAASAVAPRRYTASHGDHILVYDGCAVDPTRLVTAHDAFDLARRWTILPDVLEGQFAILRLGPGPTLDVLVDPLGLAHVFVARRGASWLLSNSARLLALACPEARTADTTAADLYMTFGWTTGDRTWHEGIRVLRGGELWSWCASSCEPRRITYFSVRGVARAAVRSRRRVDIRALAGELETGLRALDEADGALVGSLSGGRDSRTVLALLRHARIDACYYTFGASDSIDVDIAREIAREVALCHEVQTLEATDLLPRWDALARQLGEQTDGMVSAREIVRLAGRPTTIDRVGVETWGAAGGIAKGNWMSRRLFLGRAHRSDVVSSMLNRLGNDYDGLVSSSARATARRFLYGYFDEAVAEGVHPLDVPALFSAEERTRRWEYGNARLHVPEHDVYSPFATRAWVHAALSLRPLRRYSSPLHYRILSRLAPDLHAIRYDKSWPSQVPGLNLVDVPGWKARLARRGPGRDGHSGLSRVPVGNWRRPERFALFEAKREDIRSLCLDSPTAAAWHAVDRTTFERIMSPSTDPDERRRRVNGLLYFAAPFYYEATLRER